MMTRRPIRPPGPRPWRSALLIVVLAVLASGLAVLAQSAMATPAAGTVITNQAAASYRVCLDGPCTTRSEVFSVTSNLVTTLIQAVPGMALLDDQTRPARPGALVYFPHTLANTGNSPDRYQLCVDQVSTDIERWAVYHDADSDGQPDAGRVLFDSNDADGCADVDTVDIAPGESRHWVIEVAVAAGASPSGTATLRLVANSRANAALQRTNTDTLELIEGPLIEVVKSMNVPDQQAHSPSGRYTVTLTYRNTSNKAATDLVLEDRLPVTSVGGVSAGMSYVPGSARWSGTGATVLSDADDGTQSSGSGSITFCAYDGTATNSVCQDRVSAGLARVAPGEWGRLTFQVMVDNGLRAGDRLRNSADYFYRNEAGDRQYGTFGSNTVVLAIIERALQPAVVANNNQSDAGAGVNDSSDSGNLITVPAATQGGTVMFTNVIWNTGDGEDSFNLRLDRSGDRLGNALADPFPDSTLMRLTHADAASPLTDTNGDGIVDTGPIPVPDGNGLCPPRFVGDGQHCGVVIVVRAILAGDIQGGPFTVTLRATSNTDPAVHNALSNRLTVIASAGVDLTGQRPVDGSAPGEGNGPEAQPVTTLNLAPGASGLLPVYINNTGSRDDTFDLAYSNGNFSAGVLPPGWQAALLADGGAGDCSTVGGAVANTGLIPAGGHRLLCIRITAPADASGNQVVPLYLRTRSPTTGAVDLLYSSVVVSAGPGLSLSPDQAGQVEPGASIVYSHNLLNTGNVALTNVTLVPGAATVPGWSLVLFEDSNGNAQWDPGDAQRQSGQALAAGGDGVLAVGEALVVFTRVFAPASAGLGNSVVHTLIAHGTGGAHTVQASATDTTTVNNTDVDVTKEQALDSNCDGVADGPGTCSAAGCFVYRRFLATPGRQCVMYRLTATNTGPRPLYQVTLSDRTQPFTTYLAAALQCSAPAGSCNAAVLAPPDHGTGDISVNVGVLGAAESATLIFGLRVQ